MVCSALFLHCLCESLEKGNFVIHPFRLWHKKGEKVKAHEHCSYHQRALEQADLLKQTLEKPHIAITAQVVARKVANIKRIVQCLIRLLVLSCIVSSSALLSVEMLKALNHQAILGIFLHC